MICPECQTEFEGAVCPHCGAKAPEEPPKVDLAKTPEPEQAPTPEPEQAPASEPTPEPAPEPAPEPEIAPEPPKNEPIVPYIVLSAIGILILGVTAASMLIPRLVLGETGYPSRKDEDSKIFSLPDDLREREQKSRKDRDSRNDEYSYEDEYSHHMYESGDRLWGVPGELGVDYYADACNVGEDIAPGVYMVISDTFGEFRDDENEPCYGDFTYSIYSTYTRTDSRRIGGGWEQNNAYCLENNMDIEQQGHILDVVEVVFEFKARILFACPVGIGDLGPSSQARLNRMAHAVIGNVLLQLLNRFQKIVKNCS